MGLLKKLNRKFRNERARTRAYQLSGELQRWYATHACSDWQKKRVDDIRELYEGRIKDLEVAHDHAASRTSEEFMQLELDYLIASNSFKEKNPKGSEMPWSPGASMGMFARAFLKNLIVRAKSLGLKLDGKETATK